MYIACHRRPFFKKKNIIIYLLVYYEFLNIKRIDTSSDAWKHPWLLPTEKYLEQDKLHQKKTQI